MPESLLRYFVFAQQATINAAAKTSLQDNVVIAIVFSVVGAQTFINEAFEVASQFEPGESDQKQSQLSLNSGDKSKSLGGSS
jgi:hypothetical protein